MARPMTGDIGTKIEMTLDQDLDGISTATYYVKKPSGTIVTWSCVIEDEATGVIYYNTASASDFNEGGEYFINAVLVFDDGSSFTTDGVPFKVYTKFMV